MSASPVLSSFLSSFPLFSLHLPPKAVENKRYDEKTYFPQNASENKRFLNDFPMLVESFPMSQLLIVKVAYYVSELMFFFQSSDCTAVPMKISSIDDSIASILSSLQQNNFDVLDIEIVSAVIYFRFLLRIGFSDCASIPSSGYSLHLIFFVCLLISHKYNAETRTINNISWLNLIRSVRLSGFPQISLSQFNHLEKNVLIGLNYSLCVNYSLYDTFSRSFVGSHFVELVNELKGGMDDERV